MPRLALFDLDGTLLPTDTQWLFFRYVMRREPARVVLLVWFILLVPLWFCKVLGTREMKRVFMAYLWKMPADRLREYAADFARSDVRPMLFPRMIAEIERHRREGRTLVLNSASPALWVEEIGAMLGFHHSIGTPVQVEPIMPLFPEISGPNNKREAKLPRMASRGLLPCDEADSWAYSDSEADLPMLGLVKNIVLTAPNAVFTMEGVRKGWTIWDREALATVPTAGS